MLRLKQLAADKLQSGTVLFVENSSLMMGKINLRQCKNIFWY
jgi:hypothetical protein